MQLSRRGIVSSVYIHWPEIDRSLQKPLYSTRTVMDKEYIFIQFVTVTPKDMLTSVHISGILTLEITGLCVLKLLGSILLFPLHPII